MGKASLKFEPENSIRSEMLANLGDISQIEIFNNQILCVVYIRPEKTKGGIILAEQSRAEDKYQSKVGLVVKKGPDAFIDASEQWFKEMDIQMHDWVVFRPSDGWSITINGILCRILDDTNVRGRIQSPEQVW
jgi:co-chaperonin GroES (HSP10)